MNTKREVCALSLLLSAAIVVSCGDDAGSPGASQAGSAGQSGGGSTSAGTGGSLNSGGSDTSAGKSGSSSGGSAGSGGGGKAGANPGGAANGGAAEGGAGGEGGDDPVVDCTTVPSKPVMVEELSGPRAYHDIAFDKSGNLIGNNNSDLLKTALGGMPKVMLAGIGQVEGMDQFPNGDLVVATVMDEDDLDMTLLRVTPEGGQEEIASLDYGAYGVRIGPDGFIYVATSDRLLRIDPVTGKKQQVPTQIEFWSPRVLDYSPDKKKLYVGTLAFDEGGGTVYVFDLDEKGTPVGEPKLFAQHVGDGYHDGLSVDACGNLFVADFTSTALYRITPSGEVTLYQDWKETFGKEPSDYGHGIEWGSGMGGWDRNSIYLPQPYDDNTVVRVVVGVPARPR